MKNINGLGCNNSDLPTNCKADKSPTCVNKSHKKSKRRYRGSILIGEV